MGDVPRGLGHPRGAAHEKGEEGEGARRGTHGPGEYHGWRAEMKRRPYIAARATSCEDSQRLCSESFVPNKLWRGPARDSDKGMVDSPVWTLDELLRFGGHPDDAVRAWATARLGVARAPTAYEALLRALDDPFAGVLMEALRALQTLGHRVDTTPARDALRSIATRGDGQPDSVTRLAEQVLLRAGDEEAAGRVLETCFRDEVELGALWFALVETAPGRVLHRATELGLLSSPRINPVGAVLMLPRVAPREALPALYAKINPIDDKGWGEVLLHELLLRAGAEHVCDPGAEDLEALAGWLEGRVAVATGPTREAVARWFSRKAFEVPLKAIRARQWGAAVAWCGQWCAALEDDEDRDDEAAQWARGVLRLMGSDRALRGRHAFAAVSLAVAASERALERTHPFAACSLEEQIVRTCISPEPSWHAQAATVALRWGPPRGVAVEEAVARAVEAMEKAPPSAHAILLRLAARLPGLMLPASTLDLVERDPEGEGVELRRYLEAQPEALRALGPGSLDAREGRAQHEVLQSLGFHNAAWVTELLRPRFEALLHTDYPEHLLTTLEHLGDVSFLPALVAAWKPGEERIAHTARHLARIAGSADTLSPALVADAERAHLKAAQARAPSVLGRAAAVVGSTPSSTVELRCNRCKRRGRYVLGPALVHPDPLCSKREGWDGVTFSRIVVCKHCGAEDDYTLGNTALLSIVTESLQQRTKGSRPEAEGAGADPMTFGHARLSDGTSIRRASDALRHWLQKIDRSPNDAEAWLRLGLVYKTNDRVEEAAKALRRAMALRPKHLEAPSALLSLLLERGRVREGTDLLPAILEALPHSSATPRVRSLAVRPLVQVLRDAVEAGVWCGLRVSWKDSGGTVHRGSLALKGITRWERLCSFLGQTGLVRAEVYTVPDDQHDSALEELIEGDEPVTPPASKGPAPTVHAGPKPGRNDPCHCGSGKKYKRCHGV